MVESTILHEVEPLGAVWFLVEFHRRVGVPDVCFAAVQRRWDRLGARLIAVWAGLAFGVAFLATPAKFLAPSLSLPVALDVGRHTFRIHNHVEPALLAALLIPAAMSRSRLRWCLALAPPAVVVLLEAAWLIPALDARVAVILADGGARLAPSALHALYISMEAFKVRWLLALALSGQPAPRLAAQLAGSAGASGLVRFLDRRPARSAVRPRPR